MNILLDYGVGYFEEVKDCSSYEILGGLDFQIVDFYNYKKELICSKEFYSYIYSSFDDSLCFKVLE